MVDYVDTQETFLAAGDFDSRYRYLRKRAGGTLVVCSGVTWNLFTTGVVLTGQNWLPWRWALGSREQINRTSVVSPDGSNVSRSVALPSPANITECTI